MPNRIVNAPAPILRFLGAAGTVTGSKFLLTAGDRRVLVDCGLFQGLKQLRLMNWQPLPASRGYEAARRTLDSGAALKRFDRIVDAQGRRAMPPQAPLRRNFAAAQSGTIAQIDCWEISRIAKRAGAPSNASAGVKLYKSVGDTVMRGEPIFEIHAESDSQLQAALEYSNTNSARHLVRYAESP